MKKKTNRFPRSRGGGAGSSVSGLVPALKGALAAGVFAVLSMLLLALLLKMGLISEGTIPVANQVLKVLGIAVASYLAVRQKCSHPWFRGMVAGLLFMVLGLLVFSVAVGSFSLNASTLLDMGMGLAIGALAGLVFGNKKDS